MKICDPLVLSRYLDGDLVLPDRRRLETHLRDCSGCRLELEELRRIDAVIASYGRNALPVPLKTERRIHDSVQKRGVPSLVAMSRMMPAAVGTTIAAVLVLMSANLGFLYSAHPDTPAAASPPPAQRVIRQQSVPLLNARRTSAILGASTVQTRSPVIHVPRVLGAD